MTAALVHCSRCRVAVPADKVDMPNRCPDARCPLNPKPSTATTAVTVATQQE